MNTQNSPLRAPERDKLLASVANLAARLRAGVREMEANRDLSAESAALLQAADLLRYTSPRFLGGLEVDPITGAEVMEQLAQSDMAAAWFALQQAVSLVVIGEAVPDAAFAEVFGVSVPIVAGSVTPAAEAFHAVDNGYRLTGAWPFLSGVSFAEWVLLIGTATKKEGATGEEAVVRSAIVPKEDLVIVDDWQVMGLQGSGSFSVSATEVFVPAHRTWKFSLPSVAVRGPAFENPAVRQINQLHLMLTAIALGGARRVLDEATAQALAKKRIGTSKSVAEAPAFQQFLGEAELKLRAVRAGFYELVAALWQCEREGAPAEPVVLAQFTATPAFIYPLVCELTTQALRFIGANAARLDNPLQRYLRDLTMLSLHVRCADQNLETFGAQLLGLEAK